MEEVAKLHDEHEHHHHDHGEDCTCGCHDHDHDEDEHEHHHHHDHDEDEHEHHHHDHDEHHHDHEEEHNHGHHHDHDDHDENCTCGCHDHDHEHHHHHHADEIFTSWGMETPTAYTKDEIETILKKLDDADTYGVILRAKGMLPSNDGTWINFDYVPEESNVRTGASEVTGKICVIGSKLKRTI